VRCVVNGEVPEATQLFESPGLASCPFVGGTVGVDKKSTQTLLECITVDSSFERAVSFVVRSLSTIEFTRCMSLRSSQLHNLTALRVEVGWEGLKPLESLAPLLKSLRRLEIAANHGDAPVRESHGWDSAALSFDSLLLCGVTV
jgi:hypothetical protein